MPALEDSSLVILKRLPLGVPSSSCESWPVWSAWGATADFEAGASVALAHLVDFDRLAVAVAECADSTHAEGFVSRVFFVANGQIFVNPGVDHAFDFVQLLASDFFVVVEVKAQAFFGDIAAVLGDMLANDFFECGIHEVVSGVQTPVRHGLTAETALESTFGSGLRAFALLFHLRFKLFAPVVRQSDFLFVGFFDG